MQKPKVWSSACRKLHEWGMHDTRDSLLGQYKDLPQEGGFRAGACKGVCRPSGQGRKVVSGRANTSTNHTPGQTASAENFSVLAALRHLGHGRHGKKFLRVNRHVAGILP